MKNILESIKCPICHTTYGEYENIPTTLFCGHSLCNNCIESITYHGENVIQNGRSKENKSISLSCPICRKITNSEHVHPSYQMISIINEIKKTTKSTNQDYIKITSDGDNKNVKKETLSNLPSLECFSVGFCSIHNSARNFGCSTCQIWLCATCVILNHTDYKSEITSCKIDLASKIFETLKEKYENKCDKMIANVNCQDYRTSYNISTSGENFQNYCKINQEFIQQVNHLKNKINRSSSVEEVDDFYEDVELLNKRYLKNL